VIIRVVRFALLAGVLALAGCTDAAGEPSTLPDVTAPPSGTPTPTASPTAEPPVEPDNAHEYSAEGVEAFTLYAIEVINYAYQTNDVTYLEQIMTPDCQFCSSTIDRLITVGDAGGRIEGGQLIPKLDGISISGPTEGVQTSAGIEMSITPSTTFDAAENVRDRQPDDNFYAIFNLTREEDAWELEEIFRTDSPRS
jgi:hypothetical protein